MTDPAADVAKRETVPRVRGRSGRRWWLLMLLLLAVLAYYGIPGLQTYYHLRQGRSLLAAGSLFAARTHFEAARVLDPDLAEVHFWLARCQRKTGDVLQFREHLDQALKLGYADPERLQREWWLFEAQSGNMRQAEPHLADMMNSPGDDSPEICDAFAQGYCLNLHFNAAEVLLEAWQKESPEDFRPYFRLGRILLENRGQAAKAEASFRDALSREPESAEVHRELARSLVAQQRTAEAVTEFQAALRYAPQDLSAMFGLAAALKDDRRFAEAESACRNLLELDPRSSRAIVLLADILLALDRPAEAVTVLQPAFDDWPEDLKVCYTMAMALRDAGRREEAQQRLEAYSRLELVTRRIEELKTQIEKSPQDPELRYEFGRLRLLHESREEGEAWLLSVLLINPDHAGAHHELACYYAKTGNTERAEFHRQRADELTRHQSAEPTGKRETNP